MSAHSPLRMSRLARRFVQGGRVLMSRKLSIARLAFRYFRVFCCEWGVRGCSNKLITLYRFPNLCFSSAEVSGEKKEWNRPIGGVASQRSVRGSDGEGKEAFDEFGIVEIACAGV